MFFGPVAVLGTALTQSGTVSPLGDRRRRRRRLLTCAVLVVNNLRDIPSDTVAGKRTLAVALGDRDTRWLYAACVLLPLGLSALAGIRSWPMLLGLLALPPAVAVTRRVLGGADGRRLVRVLGETGLLLLAWSVAHGRRARRSAPVALTRAAASSSPRSRARSASRSCARRARDCGERGVQPGPQPAEHSIDRGSATIRATSRAMTSGVPARSSSPAITASRPSRASV